MVTDVTDDQVLIPSAHGFVLGGAAKSGRWFPFFNNFKQSQVLSLFGFGLVVLVNDGIDDDFVLLLSDQLPGVLFVADFQLLQGKVDYFLLHRPFY